MQIHENTRRAGGLRRLATLALPLAFAVSLGACDIDDLLDIDDPEVATPEDVQTEAGVPTLFRGAIRDFTYAFSGTGSVGGGGDNDPLITMAGVFTDEFAHYGTFPTRREVDLRAIPTNAPNNTSDNGTLADSYRNLHRARRAAAFADEMAASADMAPTAARATNSALEGFTYILFGEIYCEGVPYSTLRTDGTLDFGPPTTRVETFNLARERFQRAITQAEAAGATNALYLAQVGYARALVNLGDYQGAADMVADVPDDWQFVLEHSDNTAGENNGVFIYTHNNGRYGLVDAEGDNGLVWSEDPRTPVGVGFRAPFDSSIPTYIGQMKYTSRNTPVALADGRLARLIEAEAALDAGDLTGFRNALNAARAVDGLDAFEAGDIPGTFDGQVDLLFAERGYALWMTAQRLGDLRRMVRQYGRDQADVFPSGDYWRLGLTYGSDVNIPIFVDENNNQQFTGCLNRDA